MKVSIIIPIYNSEEYIQQCLESVLNQSYENIEVVIINDGSPDNSEEIIKSYSDSRIRYFSKENGGYGTAINRGIKESSGDYFGIVEPDDWISEDMVSHLVSVIDEYKLNIAKASFTKCLPNGDHHKVDLSYLMQGQDCAAIDVAKSLELMVMESSIWTGLYKREYIINNQLWLPETPGASYQDYVWKFKVYCLCEKIAVSNKAVYNYRVSNPTSSSVSKGNALITFKNYDLIEDFLKKHNVWELHRDALFCTIIFDIVFHSNRLAGRSKKVYLKTLKHKVKQLNSQGFNFESITWSPDVNHFVHFEVLPRYNSLIKQQFSLFFHMKQFAKGIKGFFGFKKSQ